MKITLSIGDVNVDIRGITAKAENDPAFWKYVAVQWHKQYTPYVPFGETGLLRSQVTFAPKEITHTVPYAHYQYEGKVYGPNYPITEGGRAVGFFSQPNRKKKPTGKALKYTDPKASAKWDLAAAPTQLPKLARELQAYIDSGRLKLD